MSLIDYIVIRELNKVPYLITSILMYSMLLARG